MTGSPYQAIVGLSETRPRGGCVETKRVWI